LIIIYGCRLRIRCYHASSIYIYIYIYIRVYCKNPYKTLTISQSKVCAHAYTINRLNNTHNQTSTRIYTVYYIYLKKKNTHTHTHKRRQVKRALSKLFFQRVQYRIKSLPVDGRLRRMIIMRVGILSKYFIESTHTNCIIYFVQYQCIYIYLLYSLLYIYT
jgi:hypothetical protein